MSFWDMGDHNYRVDGLPSSIRAKITELIEAAMKSGRNGVLSERESGNDNVDWCRYQLERTIETHLKRKG
jgi:hypothetical protein